MLTRILTLALVLPLLSSCFTTALWGGSIEDHDGDGVAEAHLDGRAREHPLAIKVLLTPFALLLDLCTSPFQAEIFGWGEEDGYDDC